MGEFRMPSLGADMEAGTLVEWLVKPGDEVHRGDIVAVVDTQKGAIEIEVFEDGIVEKFLIGEGAKVPVGTPMALLRGEGETAAAAPMATPPPPVTPEPPEPPGLPKPIQPAPAPEPVAPTPALLPADTRPKVTPAARRRAVELAVSLEGIAGTGPDGAIVLHDVTRAPAAPARPTAAPTGPSKPRAAKGGAPEAMQQAIAAAMARSKREIPHYYLSTIIDLEPALRWMEAANAERPMAERLIHGVLFLKATALALRKFPEMNGFFTDAQFAHSDAIHVGVAVSLRGGGLVVPALHDVDRKPLGELMAQFRDLVARARAGKLRSSELADGTVTITSLGDDGVDTVFPIIYPPQVAIVGFGTVVPRPWAVDGALAVHRVVTASLGADHRVGNGHRGGQFLRALDRILQEPEKL